MYGLETLAVIAGLIVIATPIAVIVLLVWVSNLKAKVARLESELVSQGGALRRLANGASAEPKPAEPPARKAPPVEEPTAPVPEAVAESPVTVAGDVTESPVPAKPASGPWSEPARPVVPPPSPAGPSRTSALGEWLVQNWVYAVSAVSLALAGIFFVQYGIEKGLLPPPVRVMAAILFGFALIAAGEWVRRRWGDDENEVTAYLPSTLSGAGLVSIFGGIIAGRQLYDLIGPETALAGLVATAILAIVLGWYYGPFLAAVGLIGAAAAPFLVGGESDAPYWLYAYYAVIAASGLFIDTVRRWAWVSILALVLGYAGAGMVLAGTGGAGWFAFTLVGLAAFAICIPARGIMPDHKGSMLVTALRSRKAERPIFPVLLAAGAVAASSVGLLYLPADNAAESTVAFLCLAALTLLLTVWAGKDAPALSDLTVLPAAAFLLRLGFEGMDRWPLARDFAAKAIDLREPETAAPMTAALLLALATAISLMAAVTSTGAGRLKPFWAAGAALVAPLTALVLELFWNPSAVIGAYGWALHVIGLAALMVGLAAMFARQDGGDMRRAAYATLSALSLIALALFLLTTKGALTLALAALVIVAAGLDRRFRLPEMGWFIQAGVLVISWRLVVDPGLIWAVEDAALWEVIASYGGAAAAMAAGLWLIAGLERRAARVFLESAGAAYAALFVNVLITRQLVDSGGDWVAAHWALTLNALPWLILMLAQFYRLKLGGVLRWLRWAIAVVAGLIGFGGLLAAVLPANPVFGLLGGKEELVYGPLVIDTLFVAYALPGLLLLVALTRLAHLHAVLRWGLTAIGAALLALYAVLEIRRFWRGDDLSVPGVTQPELYSYTIAMMAVGAALLYQAIARRSQTLRRIAMGVIALTIAKVFLIDISGLSGLTRVFSFLALGLSLIGLAVLNRWAAAQQGDGRKKDGDS
ncbi:DUF2339 domain-containing protein [Defluviimonas sp. WL0050]|uniref:DUF2339 domain-containing protein n=1 Tax=Albidovulum litorale TaxID=2984134 RepID=A0ABT2ZL98_9RHOB|nr:DUF2339 domain-containing protein [Defluviimonas sp. WL0050]MCV2871905.1 DUF2339 domain-containing protein [Defluviimonas sp. WL0050]